MPKIKLNLFKQRKWQEIIILTYLSISEMEEELVVTSEPSAASEVHWVSTWLAREMNRGICLK